MITVRELQVRTASPLLEIEPNVDDDELDSFCFDARRLFMDPELDGE